MKYFKLGEQGVTYGNEQAAGIDLPFYDDELEEVTLQPLERRMLKTGVHMEIPDGYEGHLDTRSSSAKAGMALLCHTVDQDYRGNIRLMVINLSGEPMTIKRDQCIAQIIIKPVARVSLERVDSLEELSATARGDKGFGSTGRNF
jgi:dUTP pyrophosphatase